MKAATIWLLSSVMLLCGLLTTELYAQRGLRFLENLTVYDGGGKKVGAVLGFIGHPPIPVVALVKNDEIALLIAWKDRIRGTESSFYFTTANCTGTAYLPLRAEREPPTLVKNGLVYLPDSALPPAAITVSSVLNSPGEAFESCSQFSPFQVTDAVPAKVLADITGYFSPPFSVR